MLQRWSRRFLHELTRRHGKDGQSWQANWLWEALAGKNRPNMQETAEDFSPHISIIRHDCIPLHLLHSSCQWRKSCGARRAPTPHESCHWSRGSSDKSRWRVPCPPGVPTEEMGQRIDLDTLVLAWALLSFWSVTQTPRAHRGGVKLSSAHEPGATSPLPCRSLELGQAMGGFATRNGALGV